MTVEERFWSKVSKSEGCWEWVAGCNTYGYPMFWDGRATVQAIPWLLGHLSPGEHRHHLCKNKRCVRSDHLLVVSSAQHVRIHAAERKTCPRGHPYSGRNARQRICQTCMNESTRRWRGTRGRSGG